MRRITMFTMAGCPYCARAHAWMEELKDENPEYRAVEVEIIDEVEHPDVADQYDYYYVPTYYVGGDKLHEGAATREKVRLVYERALHDESDGAK